MYPSIDLGVLLLVIVLVIALAILFVRSTGLRAGVFSCCPCLSLEWVK